MLRGLLLISIALFTTTVLSQGISKLETGTNRPGFDYSGFEIDTADPNLCKNACEADPICQAFSYVHPGIQGSKARCWLKFNSGVAESAGCCVSGVKTITREFGWERNSPNYMSFDLPIGAKPSDCEAHCVEDTKCKAFTYGFINHLRTVPTCSLKANPGAPFPNTFFQSGTVNRN